METIPYTYLIGWTKLNVWYYGVRYAKRCNPSDLLSTYFTSSKKVKALIAISGMPDSVQIRRRFVSITKARAWEVKVLRRLRVVSREDFLNQHDRNAPPINRMFGVDNPQSRPESIEQKRARVKNRAHTKLAEGVHHITGKPLEQYIEWKCLDCTKTQMYRSFELVYRQTNKKRCKSCAATKRNKDRWADPDYRKRVGQSISRAKFRTPPPNKL